MDKKISITDDITKISNMIKEKIVCLTTSIFTFSLFLSFIIDLYNLKPLTANANIAGINNIFCNNNKMNTNHIPCGNPTTVMHAAIV